MSKFVCVEERMFLGLVTPEERLWLWVPGARLPRVAQPAPGHLQLPEPVCLRELGACWVLTPVCPVGDLCADVSNAKYRPCSAGALN